MNVNPCYLLQENPAKMWVSSHIQDRKNEQNVHNFHALTDPLKIYY